MEKQTIVCFHVNVLKSSDILVSLKVPAKNICIHICVCVCVCVCMYVASLVAQMVKNLPAMQETPGSIPQSGRSPAEGNGNLLQYSCLENSTDRSLAGYSPWGHRELDTTEQLAHPHIGIICIFIFF